LNLAMPYRNDQGAREAKREARARKERTRAEPRSPLDLRLSKAALATLALSSLAILVMAAALARPVARVSQVAPAPHRATRNTMPVRTSADIGLGARGALGGLAGLGAAASSDSVGAAGGLGVLRSGVHGASAVGDTPPETPGIL
jgi:hypothetical protein